MGISISDIRKTILYLKRNGISNTVYATMERLEDRKKNKYTYTEPAEEELERQRKETFEYAPLISVLVPCYETKPVFLEDLVLSLEDQTYQNFELVLADASNTNHVERMAKDFNEQYGNIVYKRLEDNQGISGNTNQGLNLCSGQYIGLLDHDDLLTKDCLYHMVKALNEARNKDGAPALLYSDEDKTDTYLEKYYEPHRKMRFNLGLIMTNNYVCHFSLYRSEIIKELGLRADYDGAQDYDLVLRTVDYVLNKYGNDGLKRIVHVPHILYHWRCHEASTASNPASKNYAYENGLKALDAFAKARGLKADAVNLKHVGFYKLNFDNPFEEGSNIAAVGGPVYEDGKMVSGALDGKGRALYGGLRKGYSGYMHRAVLQQDCDVVDIRNIIISDKYIDMFKKETGLTYPVKEAELAKLSNEEIIRKSVKFCNKLKKDNIRILYDPDTKGMKG